MRRRPNSSNSDSRRAACVSPSLMSTSQPASRSRRTCGSGASRPTATSTGTCRAVRTSWLSDDGAAGVHHHARGNAGAGRPGRQQRIVAPRRLPPDHDRIDPPTQRVPDSRDSGLEIHWLEPVRVAILPSSVIAHLAITHGRPVSTSFR